MTTATAPTPAAAARRPFVLDATHQPAHAETGPAAWTSYDAYLDRIAHPTAYDRWQADRAEAIAEEPLWGDPDYDADVALTRYERGMGL